MFFVDRATEAALRNGDEAAVNVQLALGHVWPRSPMPSFWEATWEGANAKLIQRVLAHYQICGDPHGVLPSMFNRAVERTDRAQATVLFSMVGQRMGGCDRLNTLLSLDWMELAAIECGRMQDRSLNTSASRLLRAQNWAALDRLTPWLPLPKVKVWLKRYAARAAFPVATALVRQAALTSQPSALPAPRARPRS